MSFALGLGSVKTKATVVVTACFVAAIMLASAAAMVGVREDLREVLGQQQLTLVSRIADDIDERLKTAHQALVAVAGAMPPDIIQDRARLQLEMKEQTALQVLFDNIFVLSPKGIALLDLPAVGSRGNSVADREWFQQTLGDRKPHISAPFVSRVIREPVITMTAPILDEKGEVAGVITGSLDLMKPNFLGKIATARVGKTGQFALISRDRTIVVSRDKDRMMTKGPAPGVSSYFDRAVAGGEGWEESVNSRGLHALFGYSQLEVVPWVLVAALPADEAFAPIAAAQWRIVGITLVLIVVLAPLVWLATEFLMAPLLELHDSIRKLRGGSLDGLPEVLVNRRDEIGGLAAEFNALMQERSKSATALEESVRRLRVIADSIPALIAYVDSEERYRFANETYRQWYGFGPETMVGRSMREVFGEQGYAERKAGVEAAFAGRGIDTERPIGQRDAHVRYVPDIREGGRVAGFFVLASDVTGLKRTERMLRDSEQQLSLALESSQLSLFDWNIASGDVYLSEQWSVTLGGPHEPTKTTFAGLAQITHPEDQAWLGGIFRKVLKGELPRYHVEHRVRNDKGEWIWIQSDGQVTSREPGGRALRLVGTCADITERKRAEQELIASRAELERVAQHDGLTGLPNRGLLEDRIEQALARTRRSRQLIALFYVDLDHFKSVNDSMGHAAGDALLVSFAERLKGCVREADTVARLGGDEFVILLEELRRQDDALAVADKIVESMRRDFFVEGKSFHSTASIGIAFTRGTAPAADLMKRADAALYEAKGAGRNNYRISPSEQVLEDVAVPARRRTRSKAKQE
jgi:diguanylate cyclase (GGDEF)-like protein/PAS domain S-box-containing protein